MTKITDIESEIERLENEKARLLSNRRWRCPGCKKHTPIAKMDYITSSYYDRSYDDWSDSGEFKLVCPKCLMAWRYYRGDEYKKWRDARYFFGGDVHFSAVQFNQGYKLKVEKAVQFKWDDKRMNEVIKSNNIAHL